MAGAAATRLIGMISRFLSMLGTPMATLSHLSLGRYTLLQRCQGRYCPPTPCWRRPRDADMRASPPGLLAYSFFNYAYDNTKQSTLGALKSMTVDATSF